MLKPIISSNFFVNNPNQILCLYVNTTNCLQKIKVSNFTKRHLERVVFPGQRLMFEAAKEAKLEVNTDGSDNKTPANVIPCQELSVDEI